MFRSHLPKLKVTLIRLFFGVAIALALLIAPLNFRSQAESKLPVDVQPTDFYFEELESLIDRYDCFLPYPDGTFRGYKKLSRFELAANLNYCMNSFEKVLTAPQNDAVKKSEVATLKNAIDALQQQVDRLRQSSPIDRPPI
ncbi:MAG: S-layer homology domain-containing protein [Limnospira sp.]